MCYVWVTRLLQDCFKMIVILQDCCRIVARLLILTQIQYICTPGTESTKTTLINSSVGVAGEWSPTCMLGTYLLCLLALSMLTYNNFQICRWFFLITTFIIVKMATKTLKAFPEAPFILRAKGHNKHVSNAQVCGHSPAPPPHCR